MKITAFQSSIMKVMGKKVEKNMEDKNKRSMKIKIIILKI